MNRKQTKKSVQNVLQTDTTDDDEEIETTRTVTTKKVRIIESSNDNKRNKPIETQNNGPYNMERRQLPNPVLPVPTSILKYKKEINNNEVNVKQSNLNTTPILRLPEQGTFIKPIEMLKKHDQVFLMRDKGTLESRKLNDIPRKNEVILSEKSERQNEVILLETKKENLVINSNEVIVNTKTKEINEIQDDPIFGPKSMSLNCFKCNKKIKTFIYHKTGRCTWTLCILLFLFGLWPFIIIALIANCSKNVVHNCPMCQSYLGIYRRPDDFERFKRKEKLLKPNNNKVGNSGEYEA